MKRLVFLLVAFMLVAMPMSAQKREPGKVKTLVIDPGHGGAKPGAKGSLIWEKDLVLGVALQFGKLVEKNLPDVKVIYTRTTDVMALGERRSIGIVLSAGAMLSEILVLSVIASSLFCFCSRLSGFVVAVSAFLPAAGTCA